MIRRRFLLGRACSLEGRSVDGISFSLRVLVPGLGLRRLLPRPPNYGRISDWRFQVVSMRHGFTYFEVRSFGDGACHTNVSASFADKENLQTLPLT